MCMYVSAAIALACMSTSKNCLARSQRTRKAGFVVMAYYRVAIGGFITGERDASILKLEKISRTTTNNACISTETARYSNRANGLMLEMAITGARRRGDVPLRTSSVAPAISRVVMKSKRRALKCLRSNARAMTYTGKISRPANSK